MDDKDASQGCEDDDDDDDPENRYLNNKFPRLSGLWR